MADKTMRLDLTYPQFIELYFLAQENKDNSPELNNLYKILDDKYLRLKKNDAYTRSKTASTEAEREKARQEYLDLVGMHKDFRW